MAYCHHCGNKFEKGDSFCRSCGNRLPRDIKKDKVEEKPIKEKVEKEKTKKKKYIFLGVAVIIVIALIFFFTIGGEETGFTIGEEEGEGFSEQVVEKETCPYECCSGEIYLSKQCGQGYECLNNMCVAIDSDGDGLTDLEEIEIGTNPQLFDSDGDTLSDYQEYIVLGTNPLLKNTDGDRYDDNEDPDSLIVNSADITFELLNEEGEYHYLTLIADSVIIGGATLALGACTTGTLGACAAAIPSVWSILNPILEDTIYTKTFDVTITNQGNDYTSYLNYDISYYIGSEKLKTTSHTEGMLKAYSSMNVHYSEEIKIKDIQHGRTWDLILGKETITIQDENVDYEKFD